MIAFFRKWRRNKNLLRSSSGPCYPYPRSHSTLMVVPSNRPTTTQEEEKKKPQPRRRPPLNRAIPTIPESKSNESIMSHASRISGAAVAPAPEPSKTEAECMVIENRSALERLPPVSQKREAMRRPDSVAKEKSTPRSPLLSVAHTMREKLSKLTRRKSPASGTGVKASQSFSGFRGAPPPPPPVDENSNRVIKSSSMEASLVSDRPSTSKVKIPQLPEPLCSDEPSESCEPSSLSDNSEGLIKVSMRADVLTVTEVVPLSHQPAPIPEEIEPEPMPSDQEIRAAPSSTTVIVAERPRELPVTVVYKQEQVILVKEKPLKVEETIVRLPEPVVEVKKEENKENTQPEQQEKKQITTTLIITSKKIEEVKPLPPAVRSSSPEKSKSPERYVMTVKTPEAQRKHRTFVVGERAADAVTAIPEAPVEDLEPEPAKTSRREEFKSPERYILRVKSPEAQRNHRVFLIGPKSEQEAEITVSEEVKTKREKPPKMKESREDSKSPERFILTVKTPETLRKHRVLTIMEGPPSEKKKNITIKRSRSEEKPTLKIWSGLKKSLALRRTQTFSNSDIGPQAESLRSVSCDRKIKTEEMTPIVKEKFIIVTKTPQALRRHHTFMVGERPRTPDYPWIEEGELTEPIATVGPSAQRAQKMREKRTRSEEPRVERKEEVAERFVMTARTPLAMRKYQTFIVEAKKPSIPTSASADIHRRGDELIRELDAIYPTSSRLDSREFSSSNSKEFNPFPQESPRRISTSEMYSLTSTTPQLVRRRDETVASPTLFVLNKRSERPLDERLEAVKETSQSDKAEPLRTPSMDDLTSIDDDIPMDTRTDSKPVVAVLPLTSRPVPGGVSPKASRKKKKGNRSGGLNQTQRSADHRLLRGLRSAGRIFSPGIFNKKRTPPPSTQFHPTTCVTTLAPLAQVESSVVANSPLVEALPIEAWNTPRPRCSPPRAFAALIREEPHDANGNPPAEEGAVLPSSPQLLHRGLIDDEILDQPMLVGDSFSHSESSDRLSLNQPTMAVNLDNQQNRRADVVPTQHIPPTVRNDNSYIDESLAHVADIKSQLRDLQTYINDHNNEATTMDIAALARENDSLRRQLLERDQLIEQLRQQLANLRPLQVS